MVACYGDGDREKAIVALLHAHNADVNAQDGEVSFAHVHRSMESDANLLQHDSA